VTQLSDNEKTPTTLQTVERALAFLETVAQARRPPRLKEVAEALGINVTTSYHLLNTLQMAGYLTRDSDGSLRIGGRTAILYQGLVRNFALGRELTPVIEELSGSTGETAYIAALNREKVIIQAVVEGDQAVRVTGLYVGFSGSEHIRASGKAVLAHLPDEQRNAALRHCMPGASADELKSVTQELHRRPVLWIRRLSDRLGGRLCTGRKVLHSQGTHHRRSARLGAASLADRYPRPPAAESLHDFAVTQIGRQGSGEGLPAASAG
jgi:DNA-binding IclR family transcriptional regulator